MIDLRLAITLVVFLIGLSGCGMLDKKAEEGFERASEELGVSVDVEDVRIRVFGGSGKVTGLAIANPPGYHAENAFEMQLIGLDLKVLTVLSQPIVLNEIIIDSPIVNFERKAPSGSNFKDIADKVSAKLNESNKDSPKEGPNEVSDTKPESESARFVIRNLRVNAVTFNVRRADGTTKSGILPNIDLQDVGGEDGTTMAGIAATIAIAMASEILAQSSEHKFAELEQRIKQYTGEIPEDVRSVVRDSLEEFRQLIDTAGKDGLINFVSLSRKITALSAAIKVKLDGILTDAQMEKLKSLLAGIDAGGVASAKLALNERVRQRLLLSQEQLTAVKLVIEGALNRISQLLENIETGDLDFASYEEKYNILSNEIAARLRGILDDSQFESYKQWAAKIDRKIRGKYFSTN